MGFSFLQNRSLLTFSHIICMFGLILSQTHLLINISVDYSRFHVPAFTLIYFTLSTIALLGLVISYAFFKGTSGALAIDFFQHIGIGLSVILIRLLFGHDRLDSFAKIVCLFLLILQCVLISIKIIYLGSVTKELSQISGLTKLTRMLKLLLTAIIPQFISSEFPLVIVLSVCELLTIFMFMFKYTYQKCSVQYILLIGVFGGFISSLEDMLSTIFQYDYYFLGQCFIIVIFLIPQKPLLSILQIKYRLLFTGLTQNKSEDEHLAEILFLRQCIFEQHQSLEISQPTKNEAILQISNMIERTKKMTNKQSDNNGQLEQNSYLFLEQIQKGGVQLQESFFQIYLSRFKQTSNFQTFSFLVDCALELPKKYSIFALILYYGFRERTIYKRSSLEQCRYEIIYQLLLTQFCSQYRDKQQISFLQFSANLQKLNGLIENCLNDEIQLIQTLTNDEKRSEMFIDSNLLKQHKTKQKIKNMIEVCFKSNLYLFSNQFKYIYILYYTAIQKKYSQLKKDIKIRFLSVDAKSIQSNYYPRYLTVLSGFTNGEIVKCNQSFKNYFKFITNTQNKSTISQLFPNDKQKRRHNTLMLEYMQQVCDREGDHSQYECLIAVQAEVNTFKFKVLQKFKIVARIYCQNQQGFNYVCQLIKINEKNEDMVTILKKERDLLEKKGLQLYAKNLRAISQLDDEFQICDIEGDFKNQSFASFTKLSNKGQYQFQSEGEVNDTDTCLNEKIKLIEQKIIEEKRLKKTCMINIWMIAELIVILLLSTFIGVTYLKMQSEVNSLNFVLTVQIKAIRQASLIRNRIMVQKLILNIVKGTNYFPDYICAYSQITNLTSYFMNYMAYDMTDNFDDFINLIVSPILEDSLLPKLYSSRYSSIPYLFNYQNNITFQKYLYLLKSKEIYWLGQLNNGTKVAFDQKYYSSTFPNELLSYSIFSNSSLSSLDQVTQSFYTDLLATTNQLKIIFLIVNVALMFILIAFRIKDTIPMIDILTAFEGIDNKILIPKLKQLKYSLSLLRKIKTTRIMSLQIDSKAFITVENDKQMTQTKMVQNFTKQKKQFYKNNDDDGYNQRSEQNTSLLKYSQMQSTHSLPKSTVIRAVLYNKWYLFILLILMGSIIASCALFINGFATKIKALQNFQDTDEQLALLHQKYINIVAYNWLKAYSLTSKSFNMSVVNTLFNNSLEIFKSMNFQKLFYKNYPSALANQILYGNACKYFLSPSLCTAYRTGAFTQGLSVILPLTIKQQIQGADISSNDYSYYIPHICDKTYILFQGIIPINEKIPSYGLQVVLGDTDSYLLVQASLTLTIVGFLFMMTIIWQIIRKQKQQKVREEVLSLDTVSNLYHISDLKPYFNKIYYA